MRVQASALTLRNGGEKFEVKSEQQTLVERKKSCFYYYIYYCLN
jgi:hypothetical protein|tara:strand:+ start:298 stop:429 length:132 start_codon:yes stop_codon:yes gene_type:complete